MQDVHVRKENARRLPDSMLDQPFCSYGQGSEVSEMMHILHTA